MLSGPGGVPSTQFFKTLINDALNFFDAEFWRLKPQLNQGDMFVNVCPTEATGLTPLCIIRPFVPVVIKHSLKAVFDFLR
jgi:hypothetical protein